MLSISPQKMDHYVSLVQLDFREVQDPRAYRGKHQEDLDALLKLIVMSRSCGKETGRAMEDFIEMLGRRTKKAIGLKKTTVSDSCLYDCLADTNPEGLDHALEKKIKRALRRKHVRHNLFSEGVISFDGKRRLMELKSFQLVSALGGSPMRRTPPPGCYLR